MSTMKVTPQQKSIKRKAKETWLQMYQKDNNYNVAL